MSIASIVILRILILFKWSIQSLGILLSLFFLSPDGQTDLVIIVPFLLLLPELIMGSFIWIFRGVYAARKPKDANRVPVFGNRALLFSCFHYVALLSSLGLCFGQLMNISVLFGGLVLITCCFVFRKIKKPVISYLNIFC